MRSLSLKSAISAALLMVVLLTVGGASAYATAVQYTTQGSFNGNPFAPTAAVVFGSGANQFTLSFLGNPGANLNANPTSFANLGSFDTIGTPAGATIPSGQTFTLEILQTLPGGGSGTIAGILSGAIALNSSTGQVTFSPNSTTIAGVLYTINSPVNLVPFTSGDAGLTTIQGQVTATPEPVTMALSGVGLLIIGLIRRRRAA